jgi:hypothetical protein
MDAKRTASWIVVRDRREYIADVGHGWSWTSEKDASALLQTKPRPGEGGAKFALCLGVDFKPPSLLPHKGFLRTRQ